MLRPAGSCESHPCDQICFPCSSSYFRVALRLWSPEKGWDHRVPPRPTEPDLQVPHPPGPTTSHRTRFGPHRSDPLVPTKHATRAKLVVLRARFWVQKMLMLPASTLCASIVQSAYMPLWKGKFCNVGPCPALRAKHVWTNAHSGQSIKSWLGVRNLGLETGPKTQQKAA